MAWHWVCPHCAHAQTVIPSKQFMATQHIGIEGLDEGSLSLVTLGIGCSNPECGRLTIDAWLHSDRGLVDGYVLRTDRSSFAKVRLQPRGAAKPQPSYIPAALREDYEEACAIFELSPKAAATLVRRCLQGMIRDFAGISKGTLYDEIKALREAVDDSTAPDGVTHDSIDAIDAVRGIGNIGAHMEKDINAIVDVDPVEAQALIELVEMLFEEWYISRHKRQERLTSIRALADAKKQERAQAIAASSLTAPTLPSPNPETP